MKIVVGLGNPGGDYAHTRHNIGWDAVTAAAEKLGAAPFKEKKDWKAEIAEAMVGEEKILFVRPLTFMNHSGRAVSSVAGFYKCPMDHILIVHDEMDYPVGKLAFVGQAGPAGHNGVASIQSTFGTERLPRLRLGINRPLQPIKKEDFVLQPFSQDERSEVKNVIERATDAIRDWITLGLDRSMNTWNAV